MACEVTYEELARFEAGEAEATRAGWLKEHIVSCAQCGRRIAALRRTDAALRSLRVVQPSAGVLWNVRRLLSRELGGGGTPEVMTLEDVARFLHVPPERLAEEADDLPAFEIGGEVRVRRTRLMEWIRQRERAYGRRAVESAVARVLAGEFE